MEKLNNLLDQHKLPFVLTLVGVTLIVGGLFSSSFLNQQNQNKSKIYPKASIVDSNTKLHDQIKVDVSGAVNNPGVHILSVDSRVEDAIKAAGGLDISASSDFISKSLNLSQKLSDGMKIYIPFLGEQTGGVSGVNTSIGKVGINTASENELESLPSVGFSTAEKIIAQRPYNDILELKTKKVVSSSVFNKVKDLIDLH